MIALMDIYVLKPHEMVDEERLKTLMSEIRRDGMLKKPVIADIRTGVVLDGHHRIEALKRMGYRLVPVALVDYLDNSIIVESWNGKRPPSKEEVVRNALAGKLFPPKTTRHVVLKNGRKVHVSETVGPVDVPLERLLGRLAVPVDTL